MKNELDALLNINEDINTPHVGVIDDVVVDDLVDAEKMRPNYERIYNISLLN